MRCGLSGWPLYRDVILPYALLGKLADSLSRTMERRWLRWHPGYRPGN